MQRGWRGSEMKWRKEPAGYPGDNWIRERYNEIKEIARKERGLSREEFEGALKASCQEAVREFAPLRRAMGIRFRVIRERRGFSRNQLADRSNVRPRETGRIERGVSDLCVGDMLRLCLALNCWIGLVVRATHLANQGCR